MKDVFDDFDWTVAPKYEWHDWLDERGKPVTIPKRGLASLESETAVEWAWENAEKQKRTVGPVLTPVLKDISEVRRYHPMDREHAALFREFADLDYSSTAAVLTFAQKYGGLGLPMRHQSIKVGWPAERSGRWHSANGEWFLGWAAEICFMREGLRLSQRKRRSMDEYKRLKWLFDRNLQHVQGRLGFDTAKEPRLLLEPLTLISAMWLQLALAVTGEKEFVACKFCRRMFEISTEQTGYRSHREFCSGSCKTKDYRKRKRTALRLADAGERPQEIAAKTDTDIATVRSWLTARRRENPSSAGEA